MAGFCKTIPFSICLLAVLLVSQTGFAAQQGFHLGGVGHCSSCHSIHTTPSGYQWLLQKSDSSSICLNCHAGSGGQNSPAVFSTDGSAMTPGGDFYWMTKSFSWIDGQSPDYNHGHNIVALDYNLLADPVNITAPGGTFPAANLGCTSCHDPHGQVAGGTSQGNLPISKPGSYAGNTDVGAINGNYRLLGDADYVTGNYAFNSDAPIARQSQSDKYSETDTSHVDYGSGMSEWCGNCHAAMLNNRHDSATGPFTHPSGNNELFTPETIAMYNQYLRTGDISGTVATSYLQFVPFERGVTNMQLLDPSSTLGPDSNSNVMCLSCHRAHASAFPNSGRWDFTATLLVDSHPAIGDIGATANDVYNSYYSRDIATEFGAGQGQFCEKCHGATLP